MKPLCDYCFQRQNDNDLVSLQRFKFDENGYVIQDGDILSRKCRRCHKKALNEYLYESSAVKIKEDENDTRRKA